MSAILEGSNSTIQAQLGFKGETGDSAYEIAVKHGYTGTEAQWSEDFLNAENYYDKTEMDTTLGNYDTSAEVDAKIVGKIKNANSASTTDTYSCDYLNPNIISATIANNYTVIASNTYETLPLDTATTIGSKLTLNTTNNAIVIGAGVSKVKISAKISFNSATAGLKWLTIFKNIDLATAAAISANPNTLTGRGLVYSTDDIYDVAEGDTLTLCAQGTLGDVVRGTQAYTNIFVEVVK